MTERPQDPHSDQPGVPDPGADEPGVPDEPGDEPVRAPRPKRALVVRDATAVVAAPRWARRVAVARARLVELSTNPAVLATVTVGAGLAAGALRQILAGGARGEVASARTMVISGVVLHRVEVIHHVVHHGAAPVIRSVPPITPR